MKAYFIASIIVGVLASSAAQAGSGLTVEETYAASTRPVIAAPKYDVTSYYVKAPVQQQQVQSQRVSGATATHCTWHANPLRVVNPEQSSIESNYVGRLSLVC